jgi:branched-chain amino acid transport system substrate-binding protein
MFHLRAFTRRLATTALVLAVLATPFASSAADPYTIDVILPLTGSFSFIGNGILATLRAVEEATNAGGGIAGRPLRLNIADDQSNPELTVQLMSGLIAKHVPVVLGPVATASCRAVIPLLTDGPVAYCFTPGVHPAAGSYVFSTSYSTNDLLVDDLHYFARRGWTRIAVLTATDASGQDVEAGINAALALPENKNLAIVDQEHFNPSDVSVAAQIAHIKASNAQVLIEWVNGAPEATILRGISDAGLDLPILTSAGNATYVQMKQYAAFLPKQLYFGGLPQTQPDQIADKAAKAAVNDFIAALSAKQIKPEYLHITAWDPALIVVSALRKIGPGATTAQIRAYIAGLHGWVGVNGPYDFPRYPQRGLGHGGTVMTRWDESRGVFAGVSKPGGALP